MHLHSAAGAGVAPQQDGLLPISHNALILMSRIHYFNYEGPASDDEERRRLVRDLRDGSILILRNHGTPTAGRTLGEASLCWQELSAQRRSNWLHRQAVTFAIPRKMPSTERLRSVKNVFRGQSLAGRIHGIGGISPQTGS